MSTQPYDDLGGDFDELEDELPGAGDEVSDEDRARAMGWKPKHEYRGPPERWTDAATFLARGEEELPILRDQNRRMSERLARLDPELETMRATIAEQRQAIRDAVELARRADDRGYQRALLELKTQQREAVEAGDTTAFDLVSEQITALETTRAAAPSTSTAEPPAPPPPPPPPAKPALDPAISAFVQENSSWFRDPKRPELGNMMIAMHNAVIAEGAFPNDVAAQLVEAKARLAERYPEHTDLAGEPMATPPRAAPPRRPAAPFAAPRGAPAAAPRRPAGGSPFNQITDPGEREAARGAFERMQRNDPGLTAEEYVALYNDPHADVLALRQQYRSK